MPPAKSAETIATRCNYFYNGNTLTATSDSKAGVLNYNGNQQKEKTGLELFHVRTEEPTSDSPTARALGVSDGPPNALSFQERRVEI